MLVTRRRCAWYSIYKATIGYEYAVGEGDGDSAEEAVDDLVERVEDYQEPGCGCCLCSEVDAASIKTSWIEDGCPVVDLGA